MKPDEDQYSCTGCMTYALTWLACIGLLLIYLMDWWLGYDGQNAILLIFPTLVILLMLAIGTILSLVAVFSAIREQRHIGWVGLLGAVCFIALFVLFAVLPRLPR